MTPSPFCNNLRKGDAVIDTESKRPGVVDMQPRETSRFVQIKLQGNQYPKRMDVMNLRLLVDGKPEDVAPVNGEPPAVQEKALRALRSPQEAAGIMSALAALKRDKADLLEGIARTETQFKNQKAMLDRIDQAIAVLEPKAPASGIHVPRIGQA